MNQHGLTWCTLPFNGRFIWNAILITNPDEWLCMEVEPVPPAVFAARLSAAGAPATHAHDCGIVLQRKGDQNNTFR